MTTTTNFVREQKPAKLATGEHNNPPSRVSGVADTLALAAMASLGMERASVKLADAAQAMKAAGITVADLEGGKRKGTTKGQHFNALQQTYAAKALNKAEYKVWADDTLKGNVKVPRSNATRVDLQRRVNTGVKRIRDALASAYATPNTRGTPTRRAPVDVLAADISRMCQRMAKDATATEQAFPFDATSFRAGLIKLCKEHGVTLKLG